MVLLWRLRGCGPVKILKLAMIPVFMLAISIGWLGYYNWRGTGNPLLLPYAMNYRQYHITGPFLFSHLRPIPHFHHESMQRFYTQFELTEYRKSHSRPLRFLIWKCKVYYHTFVPGYGILIAAGLVTLLRRRQAVILWVPMLAFFGFGLEIMMMAWAPFPQYGAPADGLLVLLIAFGLFEIRCLRLPHIDGRNFARGLVLAEAALVCSLCWNYWLHAEEPSSPIYATFERPRIENLLLRQSGKQLCLVKYSPSHSPHEEWIYNRADLKSARIIWARSLNPEQDRKLILAFPGRQVWLLQPDRVDAGELSAYPYRSP
jgi:hypothetical protein